MGQKRKDTKRKKTSTWETFDIVFDLIIRLITVRKGRSIKKI